MVVLGSIDEGDVGCYALLRCYAIHLLPHGSQPDALMTCGLPWAMHCLLIVIFAHSRSVQLCHPGKLKQWIVERLQIDIPACAYSVLGMLFENYRC